MAKAIDLVHKIWLITKKIKRLNFRVVVSQQVSRGTCVFLVKERKNGPYANMNHEKEHGEISNSQVSEL